MKQSYWAEPFLGGRVCLRFDEIDYVGLNRGVTRVLAKPAVNGYYWDQEDYGVRTGTEKFNSLVCACYM